MSNTELLSSGPPECASEQFVSRAEMFHGPPCCVLFASPPHSGLLSPPQCDIVQPEPRGRQDPFRSACEGSIQSLQPLPRVQLLAAWVRVAGGERPQHSEMLLHHCS